MKHLWPEAIILLPTAFWVSAFWSMGWRGMAIAFAVLGIGLMTLLMVVFWNVA